MKKLILNFLFELYFMLVVIVPLAHAQTISPSAYGEKIFYYSTLKSNVADFAAHVADIDIIAPQTYEVTYNLNASGTVPTDLATVAQTNHVKVMPLITNKDFSQAIIHNLLASTTAENALISFLVSEAHNKGYVGWQFDFEHIAVTDLDAFSSFVEKTAPALHASGLILSVAVVARTSNADISSAFYKNWSGAYDYARLASTTDFVSFLTYSDDPDSTGPSAPLPFIKSTIENILASVPPSKISLGIPLFYWGWSIYPLKNINAGGTYAMLEARRAKYSHFEGWNSTYGAPWMIYSIAKKSYVIWFENAQSFSLKTALVNTYHLRGFSAWVLGSEDPAIWNVLAPNETINIPRMVNVISSSTQDFSSSTESRKIMTSKFDLLRISNSPTFGEMLAMATSVEKITGIRPAFLLAISQEELTLEKSDLCYVTNFQTGEGIRATDGKSLPKTMNPKGDIPDFLSLTAKLGMDPSKILVTCPMSFGWGGAMGPADFIPSTWFLYKDKVQKITGRPADPWNIQDAFLAMGLFLKDAGAGSKTYSGEWNAAMIYFSGSANSKYTFYANGVLAIADTLQKEIDMVENK
jgi:spore germination protein YaaH